jgi:hypothetical protein
VTHANTSGPFAAFQIHSHEPMGAGDTHSTVVTRPNSPANSENLQVSPQESGIIGSSYGTNFGPATKDSYDLQKWAMTVPDATAAEIIPDVDPWDRIRGNDPVFMKPLTDSDPLPALMTILGQIPLAQEVLLSAGGLINDYGGDPTWWSGTPIKLTEMVAESSQPAPDDARDLITETQRLMAFMIGSDRLYGSVEPLGSLRALKEAAASEQTQVKNGVDKFVLAWSNAVNSRSDGPESAKLFRTLAFSEDVPELTFFQCEVPLEYTVDNAPISIYDAVDHYIWGGEVTEAADNCLVETAPILVMRIVQNDTSVPGLKMQVPETWYVDRYMAENKIAARQMRENIGACNEEVYNLDLHIKDIGEFQQLATGTWDLSMNLFENAIEYLRSSPPRAAEDHDDDSDMDMESVYADSHAAELADRLHSVYGKLKLKMQRKWTGFLALERC